MDPIKILLQTTIPTTADDWSIARFGLLSQYLRDQRYGGERLFERDPQAMADTRRYMRNLALWLAGRTE
jgi:hypothetical protein